MTWSSLSSVRWLGVAFLVSVATSCATADVTGPPPLPTGATSLSVQAQYSAWWADVEDCSGNQADMRRIYWFQVPNANFIYRGKAFDAYWWSTHWVVIAEPYVQDAGIVRHEMLHDLLNRGDHPKEYFQQKCAAVVACNAECRADGDR
jgi:hypothetical protein